MLVGIFLHCALSANYPAVEPPVVDVEVLKGLNKKHADELRDLLDQTAQENIGIPSIFTIAEAAREWLRDNNVAGQDGSMYADMVRTTGRHISAFIFLP
jgi:hypothetical protein